MNDYERSTEVEAPAQQLFDYLSDVGNLPRYFSAMNHAEPAEGEAVRVSATMHGTTREGEAWFRVDHEAQHLEWGSEGPNDYRGHLDVTGTGATSRVQVALHTEREDKDGDIEQGLADTLANIKRLVEQDRRP